MRAGKQEPQLLTETKDTGKPFRAQEHPSCSLGSSGESWGIWTKGEGAMWETIPGLGYSVYILTLWVVQSLVHLIV